MSTLTYFENMTPAEFIRVNRGRLGENENVIVSVIEDALLAIQETQAELDALEAHVGIYRGVENVAEQLTDLIYDEGDLPLEVFQVIDNAKKVLTRLHAHEAGGDV